MSFSSGAGYNAETNQGNALGRASAQQAANLLNTQNQIQQVAQQGSTLAENQLTAATGQNIANQAGLISSSKGLNPALAARTAGQNAGQIGQQAANQSAQLQAQTQLAAQQNLANTQLQQQGIYQGALANENTVQGGVAQANAQSQGSILGGALGGIGTVLAAAKGGMVQSFADGGVASGMSPTGSYGSQFLANGDPNVPGIQSVGDVGTKYQSSSQSQSPTTQSGLYTGTQNFVSGGIKALSGSGTPNNPTPLPAAHGGRVPVLTSPGEMHLPPSKVKEVANGKNPLSVGDRIPGKPKFKGDNYANDTVPKNVKPGGIFIPNSVMQSKNPAREASKFVAAILAKKGGPHGQPPRAR